MKKRNSFNKFLTTILITIIVSLLGMGLIKKSQYYESVDRNFFSFISMIRYGLVDKPVETVKNFSYDVATMWDVRYENDHLRRQLEAVNHWKSKNRELEEEVASLKASLELETVYSDYDLIHGSVQARSFEEWDQVITIDVGAKHGVEIGDGVINPHGLVGRVIDVQNDHALVSLLTANNEYSQVAVKLFISDHEFVPAILTGYSHEEQVFKLKLLETKSTILADMTVMTSGQGGIYPSGLYVGAIDSVEKVADNMGVVAYMKSDVDYNDLKYVSVVKR